jgi:hypothetical protein
MRGRSFEEVLAVLLAEFRRGPNAHSRTTSLSASLPRQASSAHPVGS